MAVSWTEKQQQVIDSRHRNLLVSAAAGSGKTAVLVERIVQMVTSETDPADFDKLLVMTFTNAAAAEMRERIGRAVREKLDQRPEDGRLRMQAALVPHAQIQTIDSFCLSLIRNHYAGLDIDPAFRVGEEGELSLLASDVLAAMLETCYEEGDERFVSFVETYGGGKTDLGIEDVISQVYRFSVSHPWPKKWLEQCRLEVEEAGAASFADSPWMQFLLHEFCLQMEGLAAVLHRAEAICQTPDGPQAYLPNLQDEADRVEALARTKTFTELVQGLNQVKFDRLKAIRGSEVSAEKKEKVTALRNQVKKAVTTCRERYAAQTAEEIAEGIRGQAPAVTMLIDLAERFSDLYLEAKKERNLVDFGDLEHYALAILYEDGAFTAVADELAKNYTEILVDEYQDSNEVQEALLLALSGERFGKPNLFMVGDVKQSIYRFRQARPELFLGKYQTYSTTESSHQKIELQQNFRSRSEVLESTNAVFEQIMRSALGGITYNEDNALYPGAAFLPLPEKTDTLPDRYRTRLLVLDTSEEAVAALKESEEADRTDRREAGFSDGEAETDPDFTAKELEVRMVVREIRRITDPEQGLLLWDKEEKAYRRARNGDVVILLRSLAGWAESFVNGLMNEGIPAFAQSQTGYFNTTEIETVLSLLAIVDNPIQDIPLTAVLHSPIIGMTDEEMAWLMAGYKRNTDKGQDRGIYGAFREWLRAAGESQKEGAVKDTLSAAITEKLTRLDTLLTHARALSRREPIHRFLELLYEETGYYNFVTAMPAGESRRANLDLLVEKASAYESTSYHGLFHFIRYIEKLKKADTDFGEAAIAGQESSTVRIMSIHKSKGLEFPVVILAGLGKRFNKMDAYGKLLIDPDLGIGADYMDLEQRLKVPQLKKMVLKRKMELDSLGEELRVLYVAMTRAKEKLILAGTDAGLKNKLEKWGAEAGPEACWRSRPETARETNPECSPETIRERRGPLSYTDLTSANFYLDWILMAFTGAASEIDLHQISVAELMGQELHKQIEKEQTREELLQLLETDTLPADRKAALDSQFSFQYAHQADTTLYSMMSVSELKHRSMEENGVSLLPEISEEVGEPEPCESEAVSETGEGGLPDCESDPQADRRSPDSAFGAAGGAARGTAYHHAMELVDPQRLGSKEELEDQLKNRHAEGLLSEEELSLIRPGVLWNFWQSPLGSRMRQAAVLGNLHREQQFMIGVPASEMKLVESEELILIQGIIDAYWEEEGGLILLDYKTDRVKQATELLDRYQVQMDYYTRALEQITGKKVLEKWIYSLRLMEAVQA